MMRDTRAKISDAVIRQNAGTEIRQISDIRYQIKFRYHKNRDKGSWFVVNNAKGKTIWRKVGSYPDLNTRALLERLPDIMAEFAINPDSMAITAGQFKTTGDLISWYRGRMETARYLSDRRRQGIGTVINRHLQPKLGEIPLQEMSHLLVDDKLIRPMQQQYSISYMRQVFDVLRLAFKQAHKLRLIDHNPIAGFQFGDFVDSPIRAKGTKLKRNNLPVLFGGISDGKPAEKMLVLMMLLHGTRIGETKQARWDHIDWGDRDWHIPEHNTKTRESHRLPLSDVAVALLKRYRASQEFHGYRGVYLFPSRSGSSVSDSRANQMINNVSSGRWTAHDLRKLARTCWTDLGVDYIVCERLLNHKLTKLDQAYIHTYVETQKRAALEKYHNWLKQLGLSDVMEGI